MNFIIIIIMYIHNVHILTMLNLISTVRCLIDNGFYIMYIHMISYNIHEGRRPLRDSSGVKPTFEVFNRLKT